MLQRPLQFRFFSLFWRRARIVTVFPSLLTVTGADARYSFSCASLSESIFRCATTEILLSAPAETSIVPKSTSTMSRPPGEPSRVWLTFSSDKPKALAVARASRKRMRMIIGRVGLRLGKRMEATPTVTPLHALCHARESSLATWLATSYAPQLNFVIQNSSRARDFTVPFSKRADHSARFATPEFLREGGLSPPDSIETKKAGRLSLSGTLRTANGRTRENRFSGVITLQTVTDLRIR